jgi:hypothetical protein
LVEPGGLGGLGVMTAFAGIDPVEPADANGDRPEPVPVHSG